MKIKDLEQTVNVAWSPASQYPILLATGTAAQQLDASFSTNASLELYSLNLSDPGMDLEKKTSVSSDNRFHKIIWGSRGIGSEQPSGVIVGGCDGGLVQIYSAAKLLAGEESLICRQNKHNGPVHSLDFNPFQHNLLATGASESEIYIWDLNNTNTPMTPGSKSQPLEDVQSLSWNRQVQHILATTFHTRCVVWDLRKNEPIIKLTDTSSHIRWKQVSWHPEVATQLCLASEEDQAPVIQLWDLRFATSPLKVLDNHQRGVLAIAWCQQDSDLLISCGKDNRILCWNPNSNNQRGEVLSEVAHTLQWNFDIAWCPRNPAIIAASCFDGHVSIYSLMGGKQQQVQTSNKIADSFPGMDGYIQAPVPQQAPPVSVDLSKAPKWLKRSIGASFAFGGKLITFENDKNQLTNIQQTGQVTPLINRCIYISQVVTEPEFIQKATELEEALQSGNYAEYCRLKADASVTQHERYVWYFLKANFESNPKTELLNLLGFQPDDVSVKLNKFLKESNNVDDGVNHLTDQLATLNRSDDLNASSTFDAIAADNKDSLLESKKPLTTFHIKTSDDTEGLICQALIMGNIEAAVELCLDSEKMADALIIAMAGGSELLARTQYRYLQQSEGCVSALISSLVSEDWSSVINQCSIESWKEALAAALTYTTYSELPILCERLGERLEAENNGDVTLMQNAQLCYICAGSFNKLVSTWSSDALQSPKKLQELVELVTFMQKSIENQGRSVEITGNLADLLSQYSILLASQGNLNTALSYLGTSTDANLSELRDRLYYSLGHKPAYNQTQQRLSNARKSITSYNQSNQFSQPQNNFNQSYGKFNTALPNTGGQQPWQNQVPPLQICPPKPFTPTPTAPAVQPPRPTSVGSTHGGSGITSRTKYVVDPSVQSNLPTSYNSMRTSYASSTLNNPVPMSNPLKPINPIAPPTPNFGNITNPMIPTNTVPSLNPMVPISSMNPIPPPNPMLFNPNSTPSVLQPSISLAPTKKNIPTTNTFQTFQPSSVGQPVGQFHAQYTNPMAPTVGPQGPFSPPLQNQPSIFRQYSNDSQSGNTYSGNVEVGQQAINAFHSSTPGWNDPPAVSKSSRPQEYPSQTPITHPLYNSNNDMNNGYNDQQTMGQYMPDPSIQQPNKFNQPTHYQPPPRTTQPSPPQPPKPKEPLPEEYMYLQTVFDELKNQCTCATNHPQTKRKLEDVSKKLEMLYDMLRERKLSANTLTGLNQMVQMVQVGNYTGGLVLHTQLVSGSDFSQIASFMPGLKVLLQCALQLQIYLR